jgi:hypothetical protein
MHRLIKYFLHFPGHPTPRRVDEKERVSSRSDDPMTIDDKYDQRRVTELLYGGGTTEPLKPNSENPRDRTMSSKGFYIGDLIDAPIPHRVSTDQSEDSDDGKHDKHEKRGVSDPTRASPTLKSMLSGGVRNLVSA